MPAPYAITTVAAAELVTVQRMNEQWGGNINLLLNPPACRVTSTATTSIGSGVWTTLAFAAESFDTDTMHDTVTLNGRITIKTAGLYIIRANSGFAANATGVRGIGVRKNGSGGTGPSYGGDIRLNAGAGDAVYLTVAVIDKLAVNDYLEVITYQNSGVGLALNASDGNQSFSAVWVGIG